MVSEKLYRSDAMFGWSQISEMMKRMKKECSPLPHQISVTVEKEDEIYFTYSQFTYLLYRY